MKMPVDIVIIGSGNGLAPGRYQAITWTNDNQWIIHNKLMIRTVSFVHT